MGSLTERSRNKSILIICIMILTVARVLTAAMASFIHDEDTYLIMYTVFDTFVCLNSASGAANVVHAVGTSMAFLYRIIFLSAEARGVLFLLYSIHNYNNCTVFLKYAVLIQYMITPVLYLPVFLVILGMFVASNLQEVSFMYICFSIPNVVTDLYQSYFQIQDLINVPLILCMSRSYVSTKVLAIREMLQKEMLHDGDMGMSLLNSIHDVSLAIRQSNRLIRHLLHVIVLLISPLASLLLIITMSDIAGWLVILFGLITIELILLYVSCLTYCGRLYSDSRNLLATLYGFHASSLRQGASYTRLLLLNKTIKVVSSNREPLCYTFPDGTLLTPGKSYSFVLSTLSLTFMFLNNDILAGVLGQK